MKTTSANDLGRPFSQNYDDCEDPKLAEQGFKEDGPLEQPEDEAEWRRFSAILFSFLLLLLILFATCVEYGNGFNIEADMQYLYYLNVTVMMLIGFGFLMTFMRKFSLSAVGFTFLITAICIPWCILTGRFFASITSKDDSAYPGISNDGNWSKIQLNINALLQGNFAAAAVLISFGALLGKLTPSQTVMLAILEVPIYSFNKEILAIWAVGTLDMGGTIFIHLFGAYFGLAAAYMLGKPKDSSDAEPSPMSDVFSLIGTTFLWIYWPSFNGATAPLGQGQQLLTTVNTVMALCASAIATFATSSLINKRISTVDIQNATLAGGVAVGAASNLRIEPWAALLVGIVAGISSTVGFNKLQPFLEDKIGLHDSCGVHNLHGIPALVGCIVVTIATSIHSNQGDVVYDKGSKQPLAQMEGALITLVVAVICGSGVGILLKALPGRGRFTDFDTWTVAAGFDKIE